MSGRLARCTHGIAFRQIELCNAVFDQTVRTGIELRRLQGPVFAVLTGNVARPVLVTDGGNSSVFPGAEANALNRRVTVRGVVEHQRALHGDLDRALGRSGA